MSDESPGPTPFRMDFTQELLDWERQEDGSVEAQFVVTPDPDRYERIGGEGKKGWFDKYEGWFIPDSVVTDLLRQAKDMPTNYTPTQVGNIYEYVADRKATIQQFLDDDLEENDAIEPADDHLPELAAENRNQFVVLSIDLVDSTKLSGDLEVQEFRTLTQLFQREISILIDQFHGHILGYRGDGLIAYFPEPDYIGMHDNAIDCATCLRIFIQEGINDVLTDNGYPALEFRIGLDSGVLDIAPVAPGVDDNMELIGHTINLASKIQSVAKPSEIYMGEATEKRLHGMWRRHTELVEEVEDWDYKKYGNDTYPLYQINI